MGKFSKVLLVSDFDGTLYNGNKEGFEKNLDAIEKFKTDGGMFTVATGRDYNSLEYQFPNVRNVVNTPVIMSNGARLYDYKTGKYIYDFPLNMIKFTEFLVKANEKYNTLGARLSYDEGFFIPFDNENIRRDIKDDKIDFIYYSNIDELKSTDKKFSKCVMVDEPDVLDEVRKFGMEFDVNRDFFFTRSYSTGLEAVNFISPKGKMMLRLKDYLGINDGTAAAIGDYDNDLDMISCADVGAAPQNAQEHVKKSAKELVCHCNDGAVADFIRILGEKYI